MSKGLSTDLRVMRRVRDGWYVYTCDELPGLLVAGQDDKIAYEDVPESIRVLIKLDHGIDCLVTHKVPYAEFLQTVRLHDRAHEAVARRTAEMMDDTDFISFRIRWVVSVI
jgi:hypothetical protein